MSVHQAAPGVRTPASTNSGQVPREGSIYTMTTRGGDAASVASVRTRRDGSASPKSRRSPTCSPSASLNASPNVPGSSRIEPQLAPEYFPSAEYTGVVLGDNALGFGQTVELSDMDGIMDPSAMEAHGRQGSTAGANIAPWLQDDSAPGTGANTPSNTTLFPARLAMTRSTTGLSFNDPYSMSSSPSTSLADVRDGSDSSQGQARQQSSESVNTLSAMPQITTRKQRQASEAPYNGGRTVVPRQRLSMASTGSEKHKKSLFGGLLRKKTALPGEHDRFDNTNDR